MLNEFIKTSFTPVQEAIIHDALYNIDLYLDVSEVDSSLLNIVLADDIELSSKRLQMTSIVLDKLTDILDSHGIKISNDATELEDISKLVGLLYSISHEYDPTFILEAVSFELDDSNEALDVLGALAKLISKQDDITEIVEAVKDDTIAMIHEYLVAFVPEPILTTAPEYLERYVRYTAGRRYGVIFEALESLPAIGTLDILDLSVILGPQLKELPVDVLTFELVSLMLVSSADYPTMATFIPKLAEQFSDTYQVGVSLALSIEKEKFK